MSSTRGAESDKEHPGHNAGMICSLDIKVLWASVILCMIADLVRPRTCFKKEHCVLNLSIPLCTFPMSLCTMKFGRKARLYYYYYYYHHHHHPFNLAPGRFSCLTHWIETLSSSARISGAPISHVRSTHC